MPDRERPRPETATSSVDVIASGPDERPRLRGPRTVAAAVLATVVVAAGLLVTRPDDEPPEPPPEGLALVETGGGFSASWGYGGRVDLTLPVLIRNDGPSMTVSSLRLEGTSLVQPAVDVDLVRGGRLPLTLRRFVDCTRSATLPTELVVQLETRTDARPQTRRLVLPAGVAAGLATTLDQQCGSVPLEQSVVLASEELEVRGETVLLAVEAANISLRTVQLLSIEAATGLAVAPVADGSTPPPELPVLLRREPVTFVLEVGVADCGALALSDRVDVFGVADIGYDDGRGQRAAKAVTGDFPGLRELVERTC